MPDARKFLLCRIVIWNAGRYKIQVTRYEIQDTAFADVSRILHLVSLYLEPSRFPLCTKKQCLCCERRPYTPTSGFTSPRSFSSLLRTGNPAAHTVYRLMLLDPSPDMVHGSALREDPFVNTRKRTQFGEDRLSGGESTPAVAGCRYRAPLSPRLVWPTFTAEALLTESA